MITKHVSLWYNIIYNMIKLLDNYLFYFAKICLKYTSSNMFWIVLLNKNLRTFWGWFVIKHPINKNSISLTSEIVCSYMRVFTVFKWSMYSYPAEVTAPFSSSNGSFSIKAPRCFSRFSTVNIKRKDRCWLNWWRLLKQRTRECFYVTIIFPYIRKCTQRVKEMLHHYSSIMLDLLVSLLCPK